MKLLQISALAAFACSLAPALADDPTFEAWSYTGTDIYPSAVIATATVDWHAEEEDAEAPEADADADAEADAEPEVEETPPYGDLNAWVGARIFDVPEGARIKVEVFGEGWLKPSRTEVTVE